MGTIRKITDLQLASIATTKLLSVTSAESVYYLGSGNRAFEITNLGSYNLYYGNSNLTTNSGGVVLPNGSKMWDTVADNFTMYLRLTTGGITNLGVVIHEYAGN